MGLQADKAGVPEGVRLGKRETHFNGGHLWCESTKMKYAIATVLALLFPHLALAGGHVTEGVKIEPMLSTMTSTLGNKLEYPEGDARIVSAKVIIPPGGQVNRHTHPAPFYGYILQGS